MVILGDDEREGGAENLGDDGPEVVPDADGKRDDFREAELEDDQHSHVALALVSFRDFDSGSARPRRPKLVCFRRTQNNVAYDASHTRSARLVFGFAGKKRNSSFREKKGGV